MLGNQLEIFWPAQLPEQEEVASLSTGARQVLVSEADVMETDGVGLYMLVGLKEIAKLVQIAPITIVTMVYWQ